MEILADKIRPKKLNDIVGQDHLIGENKILTNLVLNKKLFSMILYGKPGIVHELGFKAKFMNAVCNNKADFDLALEEAKYYDEYVLVIDEIHRMNKDKQDILLPLLENGKIILIGLTTSNPYHKINPAIRSRCQIFTLKELSINDIKEGLKKACSYLDHINIDEEALEYIAKLSSSLLFF